MKFYNLLFSAFLLSVNLMAQTTLSGGIYTNTTLVKANSPYIVTDTLVVFPGVVLTIEPGVTMRFEDDICLEIREGSLIAIGNSIDSITFTSNSVNPFRGIWKGIIFKDPAEFQTDYCNYKFSDKALDFRPWISLNVTIDHCSFVDNVMCIPQNYYPLIIRNSFFQNNKSGIMAPKCFIDRCTFLNNDTAVVSGDDGIITNNVFNNNNWGLILESHSKNLVQNCVFCYNKVGCTNMPSGPSSKGDSLINCNFYMNDIGLKYPVGFMTGNIFTENDSAVWCPIPFDSSFNIFDNYIYINQVGLVYSGGDSLSVINNKICNNYLFNLVLSTSINSNFSGNCWCQTDSTTIQDKIYDGYTNVSLGLVSFTPVVNCDSSAVTLIPSINCQSVVINDFKDNELQNNGIMTVYPNPCISTINLKLKESIDASKTQIFNLLGQTVYSGLFEEQIKIIDVSTFKKGVYILQVSNRLHILRQKFVKE